LPTQTHALADAAGLEIVLADTREQHAHAAGGARRER
jgi:hypothetical protein